MSEQAERGSVQRRPAEHNHELDGQLWKGCEMCDLIVSLKPRVAREKSADVNAERYAQRARKSKHE